MMIDDESSDHSSPSDDENEDVISYKTITVNNLDCTIVDNAIHFYGSENMTIQEKYDGLAAIDFSHLVNGEFYGFPRDTKPEQLRPVSIPGWNYGDAQCRLQCKAVEHETGPKHPHIFKAESNGRIVDENWSAGTATRFYCNADTTGSIAMTQSLLSPPLSSLGATARSMGVVKIKEVRTSSADIKASTAGSVECSVSISDSAKIYATSQSHVVVDMKHHTTETTKQFPPTVTITASESSKVEATLHGLFTLVINSDTAGTVKVWCDEPTKLAAKLSVGPASHIRFFVGDQVFTVNQSALKKTERKLRRSATISSSSSPSSFTSTASFTTQSGVPGIQRSGTQTNFMNLDSGIGVSINRSSTVVQINRGGSVTNSF